MSAIPKHILLFCQIFGALPLIYSKNPKSEISVEISNALYVKHVVTIILLIVVSLLSLAAETRAYLAGHPIRMTDRTNVFTVFLDVLPLNLMSVAVFVSNLSKYERFMNMCFILERVDQSVHLKLDHRPWLWKVMMTATYTTSLIIISEYTLMSKNGWKGLWHLMDLLNYFVQAALFLQFTFVAQSLTQRFSLVNRLIEREVKKTHLSKVKFRVVPEYHKVDRLKLLMDLYCQLCEATQEASSFYSSQLFAAISSSFVHNIITLYFLVQEVRQRILEDTTSELLNELFWVFTHVSHLILLVWPCTRLAETASETAPMVCRLLSRNVHDKDVRQQMETFLLELLHYDVSFSALGFFDVHSHILTSIGSSVATNLIIMVQLPSGSR